MIKEIDGIVVSCRDFKESSKLIDILTDEGIISLIAKGCKNLKNQNRLIDILTYAKFNFVHQTKMQPNQNEKHRLNPNLKHR